MTDISTEKPASPREAFGTLSHHGVKGMRWGVRKEEETSGRSKATKSEQTHVQSKAAKSEQSIAKNEAKAKKFDAEAAFQQKAIDSLRKETPRFYFQRNAINNEIAQREKIRDTAISNAKAKREGRMSSGEKTVAIGLAVVGGYLAYRGIAAGVQSGEFHRLSVKGKSFLDGTNATDFKRNFSLSNKTYNIDEIQRNVVSKINPAYGDIGTKMNCRRCTFAYEMRRRGYDVQATRTTNAHGQTAAGLLNAIQPDERIRSTGRIGSINRLMKGDADLTAIVSHLGPGAKNALPADSKGLFDRLAQEPNGSRGELGVNWKMGGGHSMAYEIVNGKPVIFDAQSGKNYPHYTDFFKDLGVNVEKAGFTRLDNIDLNPEFLLRWVKDA